MTEENKPTDTEESKRLADEVARRIEEVKKKKRGYDDTDEDDGYHD